MRLLQPKRDPIPLFPGVITPNPGGTQQRSIEPLHVKHFVVFTTGLKDSVKKDGARVLNP